MKGRLEAQALPAVGGVAAIVAPRSTALAAEAAPTAAVYTTPAVARRLDIALSMVLACEAYGRLESMRRLGARALPAAAVVVQAWRGVRGTDGLCRARRAWHRRALPAAVMVQAWRDVLRSTVAVSRMWNDGHLLMDGWPRPR